MSRTISEESLSDSRYKTITSEQRTRNPTTVKKNQHSPSSFKRSNYQSPFIEKNKKENVFRKKSESLRQSLSLLESRKQRYIQEEKYKKAMKVNRHIQRTKSLLTQAEIDRLKKDQINEDRSIKSAYSHEKQYFEQAWNIFLERSKEKQREYINKFRREKSTIIDQTRSILVKKCHSLKNKTSQKILLEKQQQYYKKIGNIEQLSIIKNQKKKIKQKLRRQRQSLIMKWTKQEQTIVNRHQSKKYEVLMNRLKEHRRDQQRAYIQEKSRLKQKFKNVMSQLKHQQKMMLNFANMRIDQIKIN